MKTGIPLKGTRFAVRFLGGPRAWLWFLGVVLPVAAGWYLLAFRLRGQVGGTRAWFLWSGNVLVLLFLLTFLFSLRKWSLKFPFFRNYGRADPKRSDACWAEIQGLNNRIKAGAFPDDKTILAEADRLLKQFRVDGALRPVIRNGAVKSVDLVKKEPFGRLEPWLEVHLGVGTAACIAVFLHADFVLRHSMGWALLVLSVIVLVAGIVGAWFFRVLPPKMAAADPGIPFEEAGVARGMMPECIDGIVAKLPPEAAGTLAALSAPAKTPEDLMRRAETVLPELTAKFPDRAALLRDLVVMAGTRDRLEWSTRRSRELEFWMRVWRWVHVPASIALVFFLGLHVVLVLWY